MSDTYSAEWVKQQAAGKHWLDHHDCSLCGCVVGYSFDGDDVYFNPACGCSWGPSERRSFQDIADWLAMQSSDDIRDKIMSRLR